MYLISPDKKQYKANLHCHSVLSDGKKTPEELKKMYKEKGYSVLSITDHEYPCPHNDLTDDNFLMLTGYEAYIRPDPNCVYDVYAPELHLNLFARDKENETIVCYNEKYCKYMPREMHNKKPHVGSERTREYTIDYRNEFIKTATENGYIVAYNHPYWSMESEQESLMTEGCFSLEICNFSSFNGNRLEHTAALYDRLLLAGKRMFCHAADDNHNSYPIDHPRNDSFGAFTMIMADELSYDSVFSAMEKGEMYASMGPTFSEISYADGTLHIECSPVEAIIVYTGSKAPKRCVAEKGSTITQADLPVDPRAKYVRVSIVDSHGKFADTRGFSREELGM